jgi:hypothetical protein
MHPGATDSRRGHKACDRRSPYRAGTPKAARGAAVGPSMFRSLTVFVATAALLVSASPMSFGQAGSTGGTVGQQDKSLSGSDDQSPNQKPAMPKNFRNSNTPARPSVSGQWTWTSKCGDGSVWSGTFDLEQGADGAVTGSASGNDGSGALSGRLSGNTFIGSRSYPHHSNQIILTVGRNSLHGSEPSLTHGTCTYEAKR